MSYFGSSGTIHGTTDYAEPKSQDWHMTRGVRCPMCGREISDRARYCKKHGQWMRRKIDAQVARLLAWRDMRRAEREAHNE